MRRTALMATLVGTTLLAAPLGAQALRGRGPDKVPPGHQPPPGMCRIWIDGVPPGQQPAPTDCASAVRNRPSNGRVIFGEDAGKGKGKKYKGTSYDQRRYDRDDDRDHRYDRSRTGADACVDRDHDGRCDYAQRSTRTPDRRTADRQPTQTRTPTSGGTSADSGRSVWDAIYGRRRP
jgi:hypothetical protein